MPTGSAALALVGMVVIVVVTVPLVRVPLVLVVVVMGVRMTVAEHTVEQPGVDPVHHERRAGDDEHHPRSRLRRLREVLDPVPDELQRHAEHEHAVGERRERLRATKPEGEARIRLARRHTHRHEADRDGEHVHEEVERVRLENVAPRDPRARELDEEERAHEHEDDHEARRLPTLRRRRGLHRGRFLPVCPVLLASHQTRS